MRVARWVAGLAGAVLVLAACGAGKGAPAAGTLISASVDKTARSTAHISEHISLQHGRDSLELQSMQGESDFDRKRTALRMLLHLSRLDPTRHDRTLEIVTADGVAYERIEGVRLPAGKQWIRASDADVGVSAADDANIGSRNPADGLAYLNGVEHARETGHEDVDGTPTTRYSVTLDLDHMMKVMRQGAQLSPAVERGLQALRDRVDVHRVPGTVWLDDAGRVRRFRYTLVGLSKGVDTVTEIDYSGFGRPVSIEVPPVDQTVPFASVAGQLRAAAGTGTDLGT